MTTHHAATHHTFSLLRRGHLEWSVGAAIVAWLVVLLAAWGMLTFHDVSTAEFDQATIATTWPLETTIVRRAGRPTLVLFLHPRCPCTRATLHELKQVLDATHNPVDVIVVATVPIAATDDWTKTTTWNAAERLPGAAIVTDRNGEEAAKFGATTSGQVLLFDAAGRRTFAGGVTQSRGHEGANRGAEHLAGLLRGETSELPDIPAFGCRLCLPDDNPQPGDAPSVGVKELETQL